MPDVGECPDCCSQDRSVVGEYPVPSPVTGNPVDRLCTNGWHDDVPVSRLGENQGGIEWRDV